MHFYRGLIHWMWMVWFLGWAVSAISGGKKTMKRESWSSMVRQRIFLFSGYFFLLVPLSVGWMKMQPVKWIDGLGWIGVAFCFLGLGWSVWARVVLGSNWSGVVTLKENHELIQTGPYALSRHPIYTGILTAVLGTAFTENRVGPLLGMIFIFVGFYIKMNVEENLMRENFGTRYEVYRQKVKKLIPFVY